MGITSIEFPCPSFLLSTSSTTHFQFHIITT
jgi:hypothetical protein